MLSDPIENFNEYQNCDPTGPDNYTPSIMPITSGLNTSTLPEPNLKREDFSKIVIKGLGMKSYFRAMFHGFEIALEPCMNGFDVGIYRNEEMIGNKECVDLKEDVFKDEEDFDGKPEDKIKLRESLMSLDMHHTLERSNRAWDRAVDLGNALMRSIINEKKFDELWHGKKPIQASDYDEELRKYIEAQTWQNKCEVAKLKQELEEMNNQKTASRYPSPSILMGASSTNEIDSPNNA